MMIYYHFNQTLVPTEHQALLTAFFSCKDFSKSDRLLGSSKGRGTTWFLNTQAELDTNIVLRHYYRGGLFGKIVKDRYWFSGFENTRAYQEFQLLEQMHEWGLPVPRAVAIEVKKAIFCYQANIMIAQIPNTQDLSKYLQSHSLSGEQYQLIGKLIRQLHDKQVHHSDLNIHNILREENGKFWLIDFDKCGIEKGEHWKSHNLDRLLRSFRKEKARLQIHFEEQDWAMLLKGYQSLQ